MGKPLVMRKEEGHDARESLLSQKLSTGKIPLALLAVNPFHMQRMVIAVV